ncbi:hypothetical protein Gohar_023429 [Gossypium harknessii]|uniref:Myb/SANT-like DNA-binding domain-containing protein n=1 Tax=Gossypium harknessii TaxID=34285 RepID=A0A7J9HCT3_9ROSI|nr:hypothetical protein [Gossypium harknessii]
MIDAWGERYLELSRGNLKQKHWKEVADIVSSREDYRKTPKTDIQCKNRIDTVKKKFKLEKAKIAAGGGPSKWVFFEKLDQLIGPTAKTAVNVATAADGGSGGSTGLLSKVPMGIPVGIRSSLNPLRVSQLHEKQQQQKQPRMVALKDQNKMQIRKRAPMDTDSEEEEADSMDSLPPPTTGKRARRVVDKGVSSGGKGRKWGNSVRDLTQAILRFGEAYEQAETAKLQQVVEMEKQRMKLAKELELQRMQFFMKTQLEISQLKHAPPKETEDFIQWLHNRPLNYQNKQGIHLSTKVDLESNPYRSQNDILANLGEWANSTPKYRLQGVSGKHLKETKYQPLKMQLWNYRKADGTISTVKLISNTKSMAFRYSRYG